MSLQYNILFDTGYPYKRKPEIRLRGIRILPSLEYGSSLFFPLGDFFHSNVAQITSPVDVIRNPQSLDDFLDSISYTNRELVDTIPSFSSSPFQSQDKKCLLVREQVSDPLKSSKHSNQYGLKLIFTDILQSSDVDRILREDYLPYLVEYLQNQ